VRHAQPDIICLQEVRAPLSAIPSEVLDGYHLSYHEGDQPGRAGVAVLSRELPEAVRIGFGDVEFDAQGRYVEVDLAGRAGSSPAPPGTETVDVARISHPLTVGSLYLPKGAADGPRFANKLRFMAEFAAHAARTAAVPGREYVVCGDYNIAETEADLKWWKRYGKAPGFLPVEREWLTALLADAGLVDVVRLLHPEQDGPYTWWSWRTSAWNLDAGWRIDHQLATPGLATRAVRGWVDKATTFDARVSDHAAVVVDYAL
jgi:exodeoxyribonuclease-3